ncbi:MAG: hypothetical protein PHW82_06240, partial [Bacteroidales bacterium]|nr:hypothetical protein [Bacteroidales bacterium]
MKTTSPSGINELPWHYHDNQDTTWFNPFYESNWEMETADYKYNAVKEKYLGQKPLFAHQIVNDSAGNLLFFIIDNNIYDKYGYAFEITVNNQVVKAELQPEYNQFKVYNSDPYGGTYGDNHMYHNICIVPVPESCNEYFIIYTMRFSDMYGTQWEGFEIEVYYRKITLLNEMEIILTEPVKLSLNVTGACRACNSLSIGVTEYSDYYNDYLLVIQWMHQYRIFRITDEIVNTHKELSREENRYSDETYDNRDLGGCELNKRPDAVLFIKNDEVYHIIPGYFSFDEQYKNKIIYCNFSRNYDLISQPYSNIGLSGYTDDNSTTDSIIRGMEQSPNKDYIYFTMNEGSSIYYFDISNFVSNGGSFPSTYQTCISTNNKDFSLSHMETFNDNKIYLYNHDETTNLGSLSSINNPNSPTTTTISHNCFAGIQSKLVCTVNLTDTHKKYLFNHQIDDSDYETNYPSVYCNQPDWSTIGSAATWSPGVNNNPFRSETGVVYFNDDLEIPTGKYIQLNNMEFHFAANKKAIINTGATLRIVGTKLTSANHCSSTVMWGGVDIMCNKILDQNTANQGRLRMDAGSEISNATTGVNVRGGGICQIYAGNFTNNQTGIYFHTYTHPTVPTYNAGIVQSANFITNSSLNNQTNPFYHVMMQSVKGIKITNCTFTNTRENSVAANTRGYAIRAVYTAFIAQNCTFDGFYYAAYLNHGTPRIINNSFTNNFRGLYSGTGVSVEVRKNTFNGNFSFTPASGEPYSTYIGGNGTS